MAYRKGDTVLYGTQGVCCITDITEREFKGTYTRYYILKPVYDSRSTLFVPESNQKLTAKMRRILSADEIYELIRAIPDKDPVWIENDAERAEQYRQILSSGNRSLLMQMIKSLYLRKEALTEKGRKLRIMDEHFFKDAERILYDEFALVLHIRPDEVLPFIMKQIEPGKREHPVL